MVGAVQPACRAVGVGRPGFDDEVVDAPAEPDGRSVPFHRFRERRAFVGIQVVEIGDVREDFEPLHGAAVRHHEPDGDLGEEFVPVGVFAGCRQQQGQAAERAYDAVSDHVSEFEIDLHAEIGIGVAARPPARYVDVRGAVVEQPVHEYRHGEPVSVEAFG